MSREEDLMDLRRHEAEFDRRLAFAYTVVRVEDLFDELPKTIGCVCVRPRLESRRGEKMPCC